MERCTLWLSQIIKHKKMKEKMSRISDEMARRAQGSDLLGFDKPLDRTSKIPVYRHEIILQPADTTWHALHKHVLL